MEKYYSVIKNYWTIKTLIKFKKEILNRMEIFKNNTYDSLFQQALNPKDIPINIHILT